MDKGRSTRTRWWDWILCKPPETTPASSEESRLFKQCVALEAELTRARRALARPAAGMTNAEIVEAFEGLVGHIGFEAILQMLTEAELRATDAMTAANASVDVIRHAGGQVAALTHFHAQMIELESAAKSRLANK